MTPSSTRVAHRFLMRTAAQWEIRVDERKVKWPESVYNRIFGRGNVSVVVDGVDAETALYEWAKPRNLNRFYFQVSPAGGRRATEHVFDRPGTPDEHMSQGDPALEVAPAAEEFFFDNPEKREVREFAETGAMTNDLDVAADAQEIPAKEEALTQDTPPTPTEILVEPGAEAMSTLNRFIVETEEPVESVPEGHAEVPKHPDIKAAQLIQSWRVLAAKVAGRIQQHPIEVLQTVRDRKGHVLAQKGDVVLGEIGSTDFDVTIIFPNGYRILVDHDLMLEGRTPYRWKGEVP